MAKQSQSRGHFSGTLGFVLAAVGSAVGLGNLWKFPYVAGNSGGGIFVLFYILFILLLGVPLVLTETAIGRKTQLNAIGAFRSLNRKWTFVGVMGVLCSFVILSYYSVVGGCVLKYIAQYAVSGDFGNDKSAFFASFVNRPAEPVLWHLLFLAVVVFIVIRGVKGIESAGKFMLPALFVLIVLVAVRSSTLPGAMQGLQFLFVPHLDDVNTIPKLSNVLTLAMGQVFFSLSIGSAISITYGSYLKGNTNLLNNSLIIGGLDTAVAVLSGLAVLPAVFAFGIQPQSGPGLIFETLPAVFDSMPAGRVFGLLFFLLVLFAALTSAIAMLDVVAAYFIDTFGWSRKKSSLLTAVLIAVAGAVASLSMGPAKGLTIGGMPLFDAMSFFTDKILMPLGALLTCLFVGYAWGVDNIAQEIGKGGATLRWKSIYRVIIRYIAPVLVGIIFIMGILPQ